MSAFEIGDKVIVKTCGGEFRGILRNKVYDLWSDDFIYQVSGDDIITNTREVFPDIGQRLSKGPTCDTCKTSKDCAFSSAKKEFTDDH